MRFLQLYLKMCVTIYRALISPQIMSPDDGCIPSCTIQPLPVAQFYCHLTCLRSMQPPQCIALIKHTSYYVTVMGFIVSLHSADNVTHVIYVCQAVIRTATPSFVLTYNAESLTPVLGYRCTLYLKR